MIWFLLWGEGRDRFRGWTRRVVCPPLRRCWVQGACAVPCFCSRLFRSGSWAFLVFLYLVVHNLPQMCACTQLFLVPYSFFVFSCWRRRLSRCKPCSKGSQVPGPSLSHHTHHDLGTGQILLSPDAPPSVPETLSESQIPPSFRISWDNKIHVTSSYWVPDVYQSFFEVLGIEKWRRKEREHFNLYEAEIFLLLGIG